VEWGFVAAKWRVKVDVGEVWERSSVAVEWRAKGDVEEVSVVMEGLEVVEVEVQLRVVEKEGDGLLLR
jgi:hypothetical protein